MWRWVIRIYVSFMIFWVLVFSTLITLRAISELLTKLGSQSVNEWFGAHFFATAFLLGLIAGQVPVDSRLTGNGWFRSGDGSAFEGLKLDVLRPWTWAMTTPLALMAVMALYFEQSQSVLSVPSLGTIYQKMIARDCSGIWERKYYFDTPCNVQLVLLVPWVASIGYSMAPWIAERCSQLLNGISNSGKSTEPQREEPKDLKKADS